MSCSPSARSVACADALDHAHCSAWAASQQQEISIVSPELPGTGATGRTVVTGHTIHAFAAAETGKPTRPPKWFLDALES